MALHLVLTEQDFDDLKNVVGAFNAMTQEGVEVVIGPEDFDPPAMAVLKHGGSAGRWDSA
jgi:hypothetical protein